jgi:hypothetical protein
METLRDEPERLGLNVRAELLDFYTRYYSAHRMTLAVMARGTVSQCQTKCFLHSVRQFFLFRFDINGDFGTLGCFLNLS